MNRVSTKTKLRMGVVPRKGRPMGDGVTSEELDVLLEAPKADDRTRRPHPTKRKDRTKDPS